MKSKFFSAPEQSSLVLRGGRHDPEVYKTTAWRPPRMADLPSWRGAKRIGFDFEGKDSTLQELGPGVRRPGNYTVGYSFCIEDLTAPASQWPKFYVPYRHGHEHISGSFDDNVEGDALGYLRDQMKDFDGELVGANLPYDLDWAWELGVKMPKVKGFLDVQVADPLLYELHDHYSLEAIGQRRNIGGKDETLLREAARQYGLDPKKDMWMLPARLVGGYAEVDALRPLQIMRQQEKEMEEQGIEDCWKMECRLLPILVRMTRKGVRVDQDRLAKVEQWTKEQEQIAFDKVYDETGVRIPVGDSMNTDLLRRALEAAGLAHLIGSTVKGKDSITKDIFAGEEHPVAKALARARQVATVRTTFVAGVRKHITADGRIHCTFNQIRKTDDTTGESSGVAYGRLSASHPNMQNQPGNSRFSGDNEIGPMWRSIYLPEPEQYWAALDLKQQEPKWSFHYGAILEERGIRGVRGAIALCQRLCENPLLDTYEPIVEVAGVPRPTAKVIWLARTYGQGDGTLCEGLGLPTREVTYNRRLWRTVPLDSPEGEEAMAREGSFSWKGAGPEGQVIIDKFDSEMSFLKVSAKQAKKRADERGYVMLLSGRRCHFEKGAEGKYEWTHKAFNRIIQGTSAEQTKRIMIALDDAGYGDLLMLQVHDEVDPSVESREQAEAMAEVMRHAVPMKVPTVVDIEVGPSWGESMSVERKDANGKKVKEQYKWALG